MSSPPSLSIEAERHQLLVEWNDTAGPSPDRCLFDLFMKQAAETPHAVAITAGPEELTYAVLRDGALVLGRHLRRLGVGPEVTVGLGLERSAQAVTAMLGILAAGGAFVPLDPSYPAERLRQMAEDAALCLVVTGGATAGRLPHLPGVRRVDLDCLDDLESLDELNVLGAAGPDALAYVMFTSGSTGRPKGVAVPHRAVTRLVRGANYARLGAAEVFLQYAPLSFDASTLEIWGSLLNGGRLVIPPAGRLSLERLGREIADNGVTVAWLTAGLFHEMVDGNPEGLRPLRQLLAGGDVLSPPHVRRALQALPGLTLVNGYGPTENTTFTCCHVLSAPLPGGAAVPIGRPIAGTRVYLLDEALEPVPIGAVAALYAAGSGLARGYASQPALTAERFVPHPFPETPGERLYATGDLARFRPDGSLEFLGRRDQQVKVRGFRIELGEIEGALLSEPGVRDAVVVVREGTGGHKMLVAYVVPTPGEPPAAEDLRAGLGRRLPEHMMPAAFVLLDELPLTPNGKVDRQALPAPDFTLGAAAYRAPGSLVETALAGIWAEILEVPRVGLDDDFFALGGHSLCAAQMVSLLRASLGIELPIEVLFSAPSLRDVARWIEGTLGTNREAAALPAPAARASRDGVLPLSFPQLRLWFLHRMDPASPVYNIPLGWCIHGALDLAGFAAALAALVSRHEALRTVFSEVGGEPVQIILPQPASVLAVVDLSGLLAAARAAEQRRVDAAEARAPFNLGTGPLLRALILVLEEQEHALLLDIHHIATDGWSMGVLARDVEALYAAARTGWPAALPVLPIQYADFANWQWDQRDSRAVEEQLAYWRRHLAGLTPLDLPADRTRPPLPSFRGAVLTLPLAPHLTRALRSLGRREGATLFMTLLAAFAALLHRTSGQDDLTLGAPMANRRWREVEDLIGFFVGSLVLRLDATGGPTFRELLGRVRDTALAAFAHQDVPFERLVEELQPQRDSSRNPLFQVLFQLLDAALPPPLALADLQCKPLARSSETARFDLELAFHETAGELVGVAELSRDLFDNATIQRLLEQYARLLEGIVAAPAARLADLPLLSAAESHQLLVEWNDTGQARRCEPLLHELFSAQAARSPGTVAVVFAGERVTYADLDARADRLAHVLRGQGLQAEELVGICMERSVEMVVGLLGVLKAGGAYVPLDPDYPQERLEFMLADSGVRILLTQERLLAILPPAARGTALCLDRELDLASAEAPVRAGDPDSLAYVIYTSGSTGRPKGAMNTHRAICNRILWMQEANGLTAADRVLQKTPFSFDVSVWEFFWPLLVGARLVVARPGGHMDPAYLVDVISQEEVTTLHFVPPMLQIFLEQEGLERCQSLRRVMASGEVLPADLERRFFVHLMGLFPNEIELHNLYGPTEAAVEVTAWQCLPASGRESVPIGRPIANLGILVLDREMRLVGVGVLGELHIGGVGLARGYWRRPDLTADRFVPDPWRGEAGARLYKTGDLVRFRPGGEIEYLGRLDHQVKIRGFRIELGEIEAALNRCPGVRESVVVAREEPGGGKRLVAYVVPAAEPEPSISELRSALAESLPEYMVPAFFVSLPALPLSPNGKVDRRALPAPDSERSDLAASFVGPRNETEQALAQIWTQVMGLDRVSVRHSFFELGGQSLLALHMMTHVRNRFGVDLPLAVIFRAPTIEKLAALIDGQSTSPASHLIPMGGQELQAPPLFCVHGLGGHVFRLAELGRLVSRRRPFYGIQGWADLNDISHLGSVEAMAQRYVDEICRVQPQGPYCIAGYSMGGVVAYEMARILTAAGEAVGWLSLIDCSVPQPPEPVDPTKIISFEAGVADELGFKVSIDLLRAMKPEERLGYVVAEGLRVGALPPGFSEMDGRRYIQVFYATFSAFLRYAPAPWAGRLTLFRTAAGAAAFPDPTFGWGAFAAEGVEIIDVPGDHITLVRPPYVEELADQIFSH